MEASLEQVLRQTVQSYFARGSRIARGWSPGPPPNLDRVRAGLLGQDLAWLEQVAAGNVPMALPADVAAVRRRVLEDLYQPLAGEEPALPSGFAGSPLGRILATAEARSAMALAERTTATPVETAPSAAVPSPPRREPPTPAEQAPEVPAPSQAGVSPAEWLLGEGTIRGVLFLGGLLVVAAAIIFVAYNWGDFPGYLKFGTIFMTTLGVYLLGYTLYTTPLRTAGITFVAIGSLVVPLNFYALYAFVLRFAGFPPEGAWLLGAVFCGGLYLVTAWWLQTSLLSYAAMAALAAATSATLSAIRAPGYLYGPVAIVISGLVMASARQAEGVGLPEFFTVPFRRAALGATVVFTLVLLASGADPRPQPTVEWGSVVLGFLLAAGVFGFHGHTTGWFWTRLAAYGLVPIAHIVFLRILDAPRLATGAAVMALGIIYLGLSFTSPIQRYGGRDPWAVRGIGYTLALFTTGLALDRRQDLILALVADVAILTGSAYAYRDRDWWTVWAWAAIGLFVFPWFLGTTLIFPASLGVEFIGRIWSPAWSLGLALLCANYLVAGAALRRWNLSLAAGFVVTVLIVLPFAAAITAVFSEGLAVGTALLVAAVLVYGAVAVATGSAWLLHLALPLLNLTVWSALNLLVFRPRIDAPVTVGSYVALSLVQLYGARWLEAGGYGRWARPVYVWGAINMVLSFTDALVAALRAGAAIGFRIRPHTGLSAQHLVFMGVSALYAAALFHFAWLQRRSAGWLAQGGKGALTYLGLAVLTGAVGWGVFDTRFAGHHFAIWAGWLLLGVMAGRSFPAGFLTEVYGRPLRRFGLAVVWVPLVLVLLTGDPLAVAAVYLVAGALYGMEAFFTKSRALTYVASMLVATAYAGLLRWQGIFEPQAHIIPYGLGLLYGAYRERLAQVDGRAYAREAYVALTWSGLALLYGPTLFQSLGPGGAPYLALVVGETVAGLLWGLRTRSRSWVLLSGGFLAATAVFQLFDEIIALPAWVLLGAAGAILLTAGVLLLAKRQEILAAGRAAAQEWEAWSP